MAAEDGGSSDCRSVHPAPDRQMAERRFHGGRSRYANGRRIATRRAIHAPYTKGNFQFERTVTGWRTRYAVLDLRLKDARSSGLTIGAIVTGALNAFLRTLKRHG